MSHDALSWNTHLHDACHVNGRVQFELGLFQTLILFNLVYIHEEIVVLIVGEIDQYHADIDKRGKYGE